MIGKPFQEVITFLDRQFSIQRREQLENTFKGRKQMKRVRTQSTDHYQYGQGINCSAANSDLCGKTRAGSYSILYCISSDSCRLSRSNTKIKGRELRSAYDYACSQCGICMFDRQYKKKHANSYQVREYPNKPNCIDNSSPGKVTRLTCNIKIQHVLIFNKFSFYIFFQ